MKPPADTKKIKRERREKRLAEALRANLRRRKAAAGAASDRSAVAKDPARRS